MLFNAGPQVDLPAGEHPWGVRTPYGILLPPGGKVAAYLRSTGPQTNDDQFIRNNLYGTLAAALKRVRSGLGDTILVLPGHSESVADATMLDNLVAGTKIIGVGQGSQMPVFRWTATGSQWVLNDANVTISGLRLRLEGANGVVKAILATAADISLTGCDIEVASGATAKATIALELGAGADRFYLGGNVFRGTATHNATDGVKIVAAVNDIRIAGNEMVFSATAGNGLVHFTAAALGLKIRDNLIYNTHTASSVALLFDNVAADGFVMDNRVGCINTGAITSGTVGIAFGANTLVLFFQNFAANDKGTSGVLKPAVDT